MACIFFHTEIKSAFRQQWNYKTLSNNRITALINPLPNMLYLEHCIIFYKLFKFSIIFQKYFLHFNSFENIMENRTFALEEQMFLFYAPKFGKSWSGTLLWACPCMRASVLPSVHPSVRATAQNLFRYSFKFHIWIPHRKIIDTYFFSLDNLSLSSYARFKGS